MKKIIIEGVTRKGRKFRPSDWAERMSGVLSSFGQDQRIRYSPMLKPITVNGVKCVCVALDLKTRHPEMYSYIMQWAAANQLNTLEVDDTQSCTNS